MVADARRRVETVVVAWRASKRPIPYGNAGNRKTVAAMSRLAQDGAEDPVVIEAAQNAVLGTPERDDDVDFAAVLRDVRRRMRYTHDPLTAEVVKAPAYVIERTNRTGVPEPMDCDDASVLTASMLGALGYQTEFATVAAGPGIGGEWTHVYVRVRRNDGRWVALDPIVRRFRVGDEVPEADLSGPRAFHRGVTPMRTMGLGRYGRYNGLGEGESWWQQLLTAGTSAVASKNAAAIEVAKQRTLQAQARSQALMTDAAARAAGSAQRGESSIFNFNNKDGSTNWGKVALVGGAVVVLGSVAYKLVKGRSGGRR